MISQIGKRVLLKLNRAGFTLIELALVTVIVLIVIGLASPVFKNTFNTLSVKDTSFNIAAFIRYAQERAILEQKIYKVSFDLVNNRYQLYEADISDGSIVYRKISGRYGKVFALPMGVSFKGSKQECVFYPDGKSDSIQMDIVDADGEGYRLSVKGYGSRVILEERRAH